MLGQIDRPLAKSLSSQLTTQTQCTCLQREAHFAGGLDQLVTITMQAALKKHADPLRLHQGNKCLRPNCALASGMMLQTRQMRFEGPIVGRRRSSAAQCILS